MDEVFYEVFLEAYVGDPFLGEEYGVGKNLMLIWASESRSRSI